MSMGMDAQFKLSQIFLRTNLKDFVGHSFININKNYMLIGSFTIRTLMKRLLK